MDIISALSSRIDNLKSDMENSMFAVPEIEEEELKRMQNLVSTLDNAFWTAEGELK